MPLGPTRNSNESAAAIAAASLGSQNPGPTETGEKKTCAAGSSLARPARSASASANSLELNDRKMRIPHATF